jgi:hypothetical protein
MKNNSIPKILWVTGFDKEYYQSIFSKVISSWKLIPGDTKFFIDEKINELENDSRVNIINLDMNNCPKTLNGPEIKFWKKSRSILAAINSSKLNYDYCIWLDADVEILSVPKTESLLPNNLQIISANSKVVKNGTSMDTGFVAINLKHQKLEEWILLYKKFWNSKKLDRLPYRYDTCVLEKIIEENKYQWKNLWYGTITKGRRFCGFEDSDLEKYFMHYWGKGQKKILINN